MSTRTRLYLIWNENIYLVLIKCQKVDFASNWNSDWLQALELLQELVGVEEEETVKIEQLNLLKTIYAHNFARELRGKSETRSNY